MYKAVLKTATQWIKDGCSDKEKICLESIFPELRESEDERIRKELIYWLKGFIGEKEGCGYTEDEIRERIAYLEKQKEQKPVQSEEEKEYVRTLKGLVSDFIRDSGGGITDIEYYQNICDWLDGRHIEQKPNIEICPHSIKSKSYKQKPAECLKETLIEWANFVLKCQEEELAKYDGPSYMKASTMGRIDAYKVLIAKLNSL